MTEDFTRGDGNFTVETVGPVPGPWLYDSSVGAWIADGAEDACDGPYHSFLVSPAYTFNEGGTVILKFEHRYAFEDDLWDGGQVRISVNEGEFQSVPAVNFTENGYANGAIRGKGILNDQRGFNGRSIGYGTGEFTTSKAILGKFNVGDTFRIQFLGAWDTCTTGETPNWVVSRFRLDVMPVLNLVAEDFTKGDGDFTVETVGPVPGPWLYDSSVGAWIADGAEDACDGPYHSFLVSPA